MRKVRVKVSYELEIPEDWKVASPTEDAMKHLMINGRYYQPDLTWMEYQGEDENGCDTWVEADGAVLDLISDHLRYGTECSIRHIRKFSLEGE